MTSGALHSVPDWASNLLGPLADVSHDQISRFAPPPADSRDAAVLVLVRDTGQGPETLLLTRSPLLNAHAGQVAFPGGRVDAADTDIVATAIREATEETTLTPELLHPLVVWPKLWIPVSGFAVTPVFAWCSHAGAIFSRDDEDEIVETHMVTLSELSVPANRSAVRYPNGAHGPAFTVNELFVWGFTALVLDRLLCFTGLEKPWLSSTVVHLPPETPSPPESLGPVESEGVSS